VAGFKSESVADFRRNQHGIDKVKAEWALICTAHNLVKLARAA
jgi:hypothetical protein|tara:strand:- start:1144 stop:1272 length:129 start_codon:yes stop_codon:yes gene_type:complete